MRRLARHTFNLAAALSLVLALATAAAWVDTRGATLDVTHEHAHGHQIAVFSDGWLDLEVRQIKRHPIAFQGLHPWTSKQCTAPSNIAGVREMLSPTWSVGPKVGAGFGIYDASTEDGAVQQRDYVLTVPLWMPAAAFSILPMLAAPGWVGLYLRRRQRQARGFPVEPSPPPSAARL